MSKNLLLATILLLALAAVMLPGCDEETDAPTGNNLVIGDTNSPEFDFVEHWIGDNSLESADHSMELTMSFLELIPPPQGVSDRNRFPSSMGVEDEDIIISGYGYTYVNDWHIFTFEAIVVDNITSDTVVDVVGIDSFKVTLGGVAMQFPDSTFDGLEIRAHFSWDDRVGDESGVAHHSLAVTETVDGLGTIVNGSVHDTLHTAALEEAPNCSLDLAIDQTLTNLVTVEGDDCPQDGSLSSSVTIDLTCVGDGAGYDSLDVNGTWTITASVDGDLIHLTYSDGTTSWSATEVCTGSVQASPWAW